MRKGILLVFFLLGFVTACGRAAPAAPETAPAEESAQAVGTQAAVSTIDAGGQSAAVSSAVPSVMTTIPAPDEETGVVTGKVFSTKMNAPLSQIGIYLGEYMYLTPGPGYLVTMTQNGSPHTVADGEGRFALDKIKPGDYPLILWTPFNSHVIHEEEDQTKDLVVTVKAGEVTDLGEIRVEWP